MNASLMARRASSASPVALAVLIAANAVPLVGVLLLGWDLATLVAVYWAENGVVGLFAVARILTAGRFIPAIDRRSGKASGPLLPPPPPGPAGLLSPGFQLAATTVFFCVHYGIFWFVHGVFVWFALPMLFAGFAGDAGSVGGFGAPPRVAFPDAGVVLSASVFLLISHGVSFVANWLIGGEHLTSTVMAETKAPYTRVLILHMTIILGAFGAALLGARTAALVVLVVLKTAVDLGAHLAERRRAADRTAAATPAPSAPEGLDAPAA